MKLTIVSIIVCSLPVLTGQEESNVDTLLKEAKTAYSKGKTEAALKAAGKAIKLAPNNPKGYWVRGLMLQEMRASKDAIRDFRKVIQLTPKDAEPYHQLGVAYFKSGDAKASVEAYNQYLKLKPQRKPSHWQRGISFYYTKQYKEGQEQFEGYQTFDSNDVENAVWRYLCMAPRVGTKKAKAEMLKIGDDKRVPMRQIYDLFIGKLQPKDVLAAVEKGNPTKQQRNARLFYAHLYLGLFYESEGNAKKALHHLKIATKHRIGHYMWDVARVGRDRLLKSAKQ